MNQAAWYYRLNDQQIGPVSQQELQSLLIQQIITPQTPVWSDGMADWQPLGSIEGFSIPAGPHQSPARTTSMTVLGIINIVFGTLGLLCMPIAVLGIFVPQPESPLQIGPGMQLYTGVALIIRLILSCVLLASGIGLLNRKNWARLAACVYGWSAIALGIIGTIVAAVTMGSTLSGIPENQMPGVIGGLIGGMCGGIIGLIYPIILIVFMKRPNVIEACDQ